MTHEVYFLRCAESGDWKQAERVSRKAFVLCRKVERDCWWQRIKLSQKLHSIQVSALADTSPDECPGADSVEY